MRKIILNNCRKSYTIIKLNFKKFSDKSNLENDIDVNIKKHFPYGAFIRLCGRSPKDGEPLNTNLIYEMYVAIDNVHR